MSTPIGHAALLKLYAAYAMLLCPSLVLLVQNATASVYQGQLPGANCSWTCRHALLLAQPLVYSLVSTRAYTCLHVAL